MDYDSGFIVQKTVDWSLLNDKMTIPVSTCELLEEIHPCDPGQPHVDENVETFAETDERQQLSANMRNHTN